MREPNQLILVTGGVRSGKSSFAETLAFGKGWPYSLYLPLAESKMKRWQNRVRRHQDSRPKDWVTIEAPWDLAGALQKAP